MSVRYLTKMFLDEFRDNKRIDLGTFGRKFQKQMKICHIIMKLGRARRATLRKHGILCYGVMDRN